MEGIIDPAQAKIDGVMGIEVPGLIGFDIDLIDIEVQFKAIDGIGVAADIVLIPVITEEIGAGNLVGVDVFPFYVSVAVPILIECIAVEVEAVVAKVAAEVEVVLFVDVMTDE